MRFLTFDDFGGRIGTTYDVLVNGGTIPLRLEEAQPRPDVGRQGGSFRLVFRGPLNPVLPQAIYPFRRGTDVCEIFVVPIEQKPAGIGYEAVFF
jgi:hypothetical protein